MIKFSYSNTKDKDIYYLLRTNIFENFFLLETNEKIYVFLDSLELDAFKEGNKNPKIEAVSIMPFIKPAIEMEAKEDFLGNVALSILRKYGLERSEIEVSIRIPLDLADLLRQKGLRIRVKKPFRPEREFKREEEVKAIEESIQKTLPAFKKVEDVLSESKINGENLIYQSEILTSEILKKEVEKIFFDADLLNSESLIISSGHQTALPHHLGSGPILANAPIICDLFPVSKNTGYFADTTRTYLKGKPSEKIQKMYDSTLKAQETALSLIKPGVKAKDIHDAAAQSFIRDGFDVGETGFIHSLGHGLGLNVHEAPSISAMSETILEPGHIITIEPGLYYQEIGGIRIEDVVLVTENGSRNLTNHLKHLLIA